MQTIQLSGCELIERAARTYAKCKGTHSIHLDQSKIQWDADESGRATVILYNNFYPIAKYRWNGSKLRAARVRGDE